MAMEAYRCLSCGNEFEQKDRPAACPACEGDDLQELVDSTFGSTEVEYRCADCGYEFEAPDEEVVACPECEGEELEKLAKSTFGRTSPCVQQGTPSRFT